MGLNQKSKTVPRPMQITYTCRRFTPVLQDDSCGFMNGQMEGKIVGPISIMVSALLIEIWVKPVNKCAARFSGTTLNITATGKNKLVMHVYVFRIRQPDSSGYLVVARGSIITLLWQEVLPLVYRQLGFTSTRQLSVSLLGKLNKSLTMSFGTIKFTCYFVFSTIKMICLSRTPINIYVFTHSKLFSQTIRFSNNFICLNLLDKLIKIYMKQIYVIYCKCCLNYFNCLYFWRFTLNPFKILDHFS